MTRKLGALFIFSLVLYLASVFYIRWDNSKFFNFHERLIYSLPWDILPGDFEGKKDIQLQLGVLQQQSIVELLKTNPENFKGVQLGTHLDIKYTHLKDSYIVIRYKNMHDRCKWGDIKCYFSWFNFPIVEHIYGPAHMSEYCNIILPFPTREVESAPPYDISIKWKNIWGF